MEAQVADCDVRLGTLLYKCRDERAFDIKEKARLQLEAEAVHRDAKMDELLARVNGPRPEGPGVVIERGK